MKIVKLYHKYILPLLLSAFCGFGLHRFGTIIQPNFSNWNIFWSLVFSSVVMTYIQALKSPPVNKGYFKHKKH